MIEIKQEDFDKETFDELMPLLKAHWQEVALYQDKVQLDPDFQRYESLRNSGKIVLITARNSDKLIGYSVFLIHNHLHYKSCVVGSNDVLFLESEYRSGTTSGIRLIKASEDVLFERGVNRITWHIKPGNDWSLILERMGYDLEEKIMGKLLTGVHHGI